MNNAGIKTNRVGRGWLVFLALVILWGLLLVWNQDVTGTCELVPADYQDKAMPEGWKEDPKVLSAGKAIYVGEAKPSVKCVMCHGEDGKPTQIGRGAPDFSDHSEKCTQGSDAQWFWRISEGKRQTIMPGWKTHLTEEERWQVIAYLHTFAHKGK